MRVLDLRNPEDPSQLDRMAPAKLLATMCYPYDVAGRQAFYGAIQRSTGVLKPRRRPFSSQQMWSAYHIHLGRGTQVGQLFLGRIYLHANDHSSSLNSAIDLQRPLLPKWTREDELTWRDTEDPERLPRKRDKLLKAFSAYGPVAHLWAAWAYGEQIQASQGELPEKAENGLERWPVYNLPITRLVGYAERFAEMYALLPQQKRSNSGFARAKRYHVIVPSHLRESPKVRARPEGAK